MAITKLRFFTFLPRELANDPCHRHRPSRRRGIRVPANVLRDGHAQQAARGIINMRSVACGRIVRYGVSGSIWTSLLFCWPSVHMLERTLGSELFCTSMWRVLMESGRR